MALVWRFQPAGAKAVVQSQRAEPARAFGEPHITITCDVAFEDELPARDALAHNATLAVGALALRGRTVVLRQLKHIAHEAARLRQIWGVSGQGCSF